MKGGTQAALTLGVGYLLGRRRRFRRAAVLAGAMATGGASALGSTALRRGAKAVGSSDAIGKMAPQLGAVGDVVRGRLIKVGKAAAVAAVSKRIDALSDSLQERTRTLRDPAGTATGTVTDAGETVRSKTSRRRRRDDEPSSHDDRDDYAGEDEAEYEDDDEYEDADEAGYEDEDAPDDYADSNGAGRRGVRAADDEPAMTIRPTGKSRRKTS